MIMIIIELLNITLIIPNLVNKINKETDKNELYNIYTNNILNTWMSKMIGCYLADNIKEQYSLHQKAVIYVYNDYLFENYKQDILSYSNNNFVLNHNFIILF